MVTATSDLWIIKWIGSPPIETYTHALFTTMFDRMYVCRITTEGGYAYLAVKFRTSVRLENIRSVFRDSNGPLQSAFAAYGSFCDSLKYFYPKIKEMGSPLYYLSRSQGLTVVPFQETLDELQTILDSYIKRVASSICYTNVIKSPRKRTAINDSVQEDLPVQIKKALKKSAERTRPEVWYVTSNDYGKVMDLLRIKYGKSIFKIGQDKLQDWSVDKCVCIYELCPGCPYLSFNELLGLFGRYGFSITRDFKTFSFHFDIVVMVTELPLTTFKTVCEDRQLSIELLQIDYTCDMS